MKTIVSVGVVIALFVAGTVVAQLNQSGGAGTAVSISSALPAGSNVIGNVGLNGSVPAGSNVIGNVGLNGAIPTGANVIGNVGLNGAIPAGANVIGNVGLNGAIPAGTNSIGSVTSVPKTACGTTAYDSGIVSLPTTSTAVTATATCVNALLFVNTTASTQTVTVTDNQGSPVAYLSSFQIPANSTFLYGLQYAKLAGGVKWFATNATAVNAQIVGLQ